MASLQASIRLFPSPSSACGGSSRIQAAISVPKLPRFRFSVPGKQARNLLEELNSRDLFATTVPMETLHDIKRNDESVVNSTTRATAQLYAILEAVADRIETHQNIGEQRDNWNSLLLNSVNMITLAAATMAGVAATVPDDGAPLFSLKLSSTLLFSAATGMLFVMNKIQPSQLAEEQRNATRLFKQLYNKIKTTLALRDPTELDVKNAMDKVLALDRAYPLPLLGKMIEKFPAKFEPAVWWPKPKNSQKRIMKPNKSGGLNEELKIEMREVLEVIQTKDSEDYMRLGDLALKVNKILAISGPLLTGIAAASSAFVGNGSWAAVVAVVAGALASTVTMFEHAGQIGMVVEMYRNCAGFFSLMEQSIESAVEERDWLEIGEDKQVLETKVALQLGRSLSELRDLAKRSAAARVEGTTLAEEQRNAARLFKQLYNKIKTTLALHDPTELDVKNAMDKVLALDRELKIEMREVLEVIKTKDSEDYMRLGDLALKVNKILAISGPLLTGIAAASSAFVGNGSWAAVVAVVAGQIGMVVEMYRNCAGSFALMEQSIESAVEERDWLEIGEDKQVLETKVALQLGRSLSELRDLAKRSGAARMEGTTVDEFASKLF
ncbi:hypothetical protein K2173_004666 [Erythroxylum novogranatense]|uniref:F-box protein n=1 Tax=Erythroxylum novogranatense TaxID=1862640 RepID=A0AAV8T4W7_9ROSI|nr:hypothetical protein K2173_004666 [Erythroxylum novogranatense]